MCLGLAGFCVEVEFCQGTLTAICTAKAGIVVDLLIDLVLRLGLS